MGRVASWRCGRRGVALSHCPTAYVDVQLNVRSESLTVRMSLFLDVRHTWRSDSTLYIRIPASRGCRAVRCCSLSELP